jgi:membrane protease YdiL (CAAX protease family)
MRNKQEPAINPITLWQSFILFLFPTIAIIIAWRIGIPFFKSLSIAQNVSYMISMTIILFLLFIVSLVAVILDVKKFSLKMILKRFRIKPLSRKDWLWIFIGFIGILIISGILQIGVEFICKVLNVKYFSIPHELGFRKIEKNESWIFIIHTFYFINNILGEECFYRGYILPRQEIKHGKIAWLINGTLWTMVHIFVGLSIITMIPLLIILPYIVQKQKNTLIGIIIHGLIAGMGFYLISFGLIE